MRVRRTTWVVALPLLSAGCSLVSNPVHVVGYQVRREMEDCRERHRDRRLAAAAWAEVGRGQAFSRDYADGFRDGFAEYLFRGTCEPPPLAPARYRTVRNQTEAGYRAAEDWLAGYRHGITEAKARGLRDLITGPSAYRTAGPAAAPVPPPPPDLEGEPVPLPPPTPVAPVATRVVPPRPATADTPPVGPAARVVVPAAAVERVPAAPAVPRVTLRELAGARLLAVTPGEGGPTVALAVRTVPPPPKTRARVRATRSDVWSASPEADPVWRPAAGN